MKLFKRKSSDVPNDLARFLADCEVPTFPSLTLRVLEKVRDADTSTDEVADALRWDPGLVLKVLATVNSAAYGTARRIEDVRQAATFMGRSQLEQLVLAFAVRQSLPSAPAPGFDAARFWRAAAQRAALSSVLAGELHPARQADAFTAGLLQDMAIPVLAHARPAEYGPVLSRWHDEPGSDLASLEQDELGWNHAQVGGHLGRAWELPEGLADAIRGHHEDGKSDRELLPAVRLVALLRETEREHGVDALVETARSDYGLGADWLGDAVVAAEEQASELASLIA